MPYDQSPPSSPTLDGLQDLNDPYLQIAERLENPVIRRTMLFERAARTLDQALFDQGLDQVRPMLTVPTAGPNGRSWLDHLTGWLWDLSVNASTHHDPTGCDVFGTHAVRRLIEAGLDERRTRQDLVDVFPPTVQGLLTKAGGPDTTLLDLVRHHPLPGMAAVLEAQALRRSLNASPSLSPLPTPPRARL